jgi:hypothetical protein
LSITKSLGKKAIFQGALKKILKFPLRRHWQGLHIAVAAAGGEFSPAGPDNHYFRAAYRAAVYFINPRLKRHRLIAAVRGQLSLTSLDYRNLSPAYQAAINPPFNIVF